MAPAPAPAPAAPPLHAAPAPYYGQPPAYAAMYGTPYPPPYAVPYGMPYAPGYPPAYGAPYAPWYPPYVMFHPAFLMPFTPQARMRALAEAARSKRRGAAAIDFLAALGLWALLFFFLYPPIFGGNMFFGFNMLNHLELRVPLTAAVLVSFYALQDAFGGTLGKRVLGVRVVTVECRPIGLGQAYVRSCELLLACFMLIFNFIGAIIWIIVQYSLISRDGQSVGDKMGRCWVVLKDAVQPA